MIIKTSAIALRIAPFSETSRLATWLTPEHGKLLTVIKGALRRDSAFQGQYDLFCTSELLFYPRWQSGFHVAGECFMLSPRLHLRVNWKSAACASYMADLVNKWLPAHSRLTQLFDLLQNALDNLDIIRAPDALLPWFEMRLLAMAGLAPGVRACRICRRKFHCDLPHAGASGKHLEYRPARLRWFFVPEHGGVVCGGCSSGRLTGNAREITPDVLAITGFWQAAEELNAARRMRCNYRQWNSIMEMLGLFIRHYLDVSTRARDIMLDLVRLPDTEQHNFNGRACV